MSVEEKSTLKHLLGERWDEQYFEAAYIYSLTTDKAKSNTFT